MTSQALFPKYSAARASATASPASHVVYRQLTQSYPLAVSGEGCFVIDADGRRYLDGSGGAAVSCLGYRHPRVTEAIKAQLDQIAYVHNGFFTNDPAETLAQWLAARAPEGFGRVLFVSGGSEAVESAVKLVRQIHWERGEPQRTRYIARRQSFHGNTLAALSLGHHAARRAPYEAILTSGFGGNVSHIAPCYSYRHQRPGETAEDYGKRAAAELEAEIVRLGPDTVAAFIAETVSGASIGAVPPAPGYFGEIRRICDKYGVLMILDEVMSGMGRTGTLFACEQDGVSPDLITIAKGLGAGYQPIGAVLARTALMEGLEAGSGALQHGHTYMAHATACAAALAVQQTIEEEGLLAQVRKRGNQLRERLEARFGKHPAIGDIRGRGLFAGLELVADRASKTPFAREAGLAARIKAAAMDQGLICYPGSGTADGKIGDHILLAPPFIITEAELEMLVERLAAAIDAALAQIADQPE